MMLWLYCTVLGKKYKIKPRLFSRFGQHFPKKRAPSAPAQRETLDFWAHLVYNGLAKIYPPGGYHHACIRESYARQGQGRQICRRQFNINNLEWTKSILQTAQECNSPVILGVSEGAGKYMCGFKTVAAMVKAMVETLNITVPVALHLDHGSYEGALNAMEAGFSSVMFDGSHYPIDENIEKTKEIIRIAGEKGISVEAEVGAIGGEEDGVVGGGEVADPTSAR